jgi:hypothetical protein
MTQKICRVCKVPKEPNDFAIDRLQKDGRQSKCRLCCKKYRKTYRLTNPEKVKELSRQSYVRNRKQKLAERKRYYQMNREKEISYHQGQYRNNPDVHQAAKQRHQRVKLAALGVVANGAPVKCAYCPETDPGKLEIDHVNGDGGDHRKRGKTNHYSLVRDGLPKDTVLQILCETHNAMKNWLSHQQFVEEIFKLAKTLAPRCEFEWLGRRCVLADGHPDDAFSDHKLEGDTE